MSTPPRLHHKCKDLLITPPCQWPDHLTQPRCDFTTITCHTILSGMRNAEEHARAGVNPNQGRHNKLQNSFPLACKFPAIVYFPKPYHTTSTAEIAKHHILGHRGLMGSGAGMIQTAVLRRSSCTPPARGTSRCQLLQPEDEPKLSNGLGFKGLGFRGLGFRV